MKMGKTDKSREEKTKKTKINRKRKYSVNSFAPNSSHLVHNTRTGQSQFPRVLQKATYLLQHTELVSLGDPSARIFGTCCTSA